MRKRFFSFFVAAVNCQLVPLNDEIVVDCKLAFISIFIDIILNGTKTATTRLLGEKDPTTDL